MRVVFDEDRVVVVDKDAGVLSEDVAAHLGKKLVHRIDKPTSGLLILADDARTVARLQKQLQQGLIERTYRVVVHGVVAKGVVESLLVRDRGDGLRGAGAGGKPSRLEVVDVDAAHDDGGGAFSVAAVRLVTGRTHQIRIQLAEAGHVVVGEFVYDRDARAAGVALLPAPRLLLHAERLRFTHPGREKRGVEIASELPTEFSAWIHAHRRR